MLLPMATTAFGLGRRCWSSPQQCYLHCLPLIHLVTWQKITKHPTCQSTKMLYELCNISEILILQQSNAILNTVAFIIKKE